jgi:hypothetical protein
MTAAEQTDVVHRRLLLLELLVKKAFMLATPVADVPREAERIVGFRSGAYHRAHLYATPPRAEVQLCAPDEETTSQDIPADVLESVFQRRGAIVALDIMPLTIPATVDLMAKWKLELMQKLVGVFGKAGFGLHDPAAYGLAASTMPTLVLTQFQDIYMLEATGKTGKVKEDYGMESNDAYFNDYADKMADFVLGGIERLKSRHVGGAE